MQPHALVWTVALALLCAALVRAVAAHQFALLAERPAAGERRLRDGEERPDEEPAHPARRVFPSLAVAVAALAAVRVALLVALQR
jgi:hypothetical protein